MIKRCCFAGHRDIYDREKVYEKVKSEIERLIREKNVTEFWVGNYGSFDGLCRDAVKELKETYNVTLCLVIPYITDKIKKNKEDYYKNYDHILMADIPLKTPYKFRILKCNQYMVENCDFLISYVMYGWGGASKTLEYAKKRNIKIISIT